MLELAASACSVSTGYSESSATVRHVAVRSAVRLAFSTVANSRGCAASATHAKAFNL